MQDMTSHSPAATVIQAWQQNATEWNGKTLRLYKKDQQWIIEKEEFCNGQPIDSQSSWFLQFADARRNMKAMIESLMRDSWQLKVLPMVV